MYSYSTHTRIFLFKKFLSESSQIRILLILHSLLECCVLYSDLRKDCQHITFMLRFFMKGCKLQHLDVKYMLTIPIFLHIFCRPGHRSRSNGQLFSIKSKLFQHIYIANYIKKTAMYVIFSPSSYSFFRSCLSLNFFHNNFHTVPLNKYIFSPSQIHF